MKASSIFRGLLVGFLGYLLIALIYLTANSAIFALITSDSGQVKQIISSSGAYDKVTPLIMNELSAQQGKEADKIPFDDPTVQLVTRQVLDGGRVQGIVEPLIDGTYRWLNGEVKQPEFSVNIQDIQKDFINKLADSELKRMQKLPVCSYSQMQTNQNLLTTECRPPYSIDRKSLQKELDQSLGENSDLLSNKTLSAKDIKDPQGQSVFDKLARAPEIFQLGKNLPWITGVSALIAAVGLFFLAGDHRRGLKHVGICFTIAGILLLFVPTVNNLIINQSLGTLQSQNADAYSVVQSILKSFNDASAHIYYISGGIVIILALLSFGWRYWLGRKTAAK